MTLHDPLAAKHLAELFDGTSAVSRHVQVYYEPGHASDEIVIIDATSREEIERWDLSDVRWVNGTDRPVLGTTHAPDYRLMLRHMPLLEGLLPLYPTLKKQIKTIKSQKTHKMAWRLGLLALALTIGVLVAVPWLSTPLAHLASDAWRDRTGKQTLQKLEGFFGKTCHDPAGQKVLEKLTETLVAQLPIPEKIHVAAMDNKMINAFALSGGYVRFMAGLIKAAESSDEVAGVLAHEIAHVALRHPEELAFRSMGYDILLSTFADSGAVTEIAATAGVTLINAAYSREAESAADKLAIQLLTQSNISRGGIVAFFSRIEKKEGKSLDLLKYLNSHPATGDRKKAAEASLGKGKPALTYKDWKALKRICDPA